MGSDAQLRFTNTREIKVAYGRNPEEMAVQLQAMQTLADIRGYDVESSQLAGDNIWWVISVTFVRRKSEPVA